MIDYKEEMATVFAQYFDVEGDHELKKNMTTAEIDSMLRGIMPKIANSEHMVYEMLTESGFEQERVRIYREHITEADPEKGIPKKVEQIEVGSVFQWIVFEKN